MQRLLNDQLQQHTETVKTRPPSSALLGIDSSDRFQTLAQRTASNNLSPNASPYDFNLYAPTNFIQGYFTRIAVSEVTFPYHIPPVNDFSCKMYMYYAASGGPLLSYVLTLTKGWYDFDSLGAELQVQMNAAGVPGGATFSVLYDDTSTPSFTYFATIVGAPAGARLWFAPYYLQGYENQAGLFEMMNWNPYGAQTLGTAAQAFIYSGAPTLLFTKYVDVVCNNLTAVQDVRDGSSSNRPRDAICRLYLTDGLNTSAAAGSVPFNVLRQYTNPKFIKWENSLPVASLSFQVYNDCGYILTGVDPSLVTAYGSDEQILPIENPDWQMSLLLSEQ